MDKDDWPYICIPFTGVYVMKIPCVLKLHMLKISCVGSSLMMRFKISYARCPLKNVSKMNFARSSLITRLKDSHYT